MIGKSLSVECARSLHDKNFVPSLMYGYVTHSIGRDLSKIKAVEMVNLGSMIRIRRIDKVKVKM